MPEIIGAVLAIGSVVWLVARRPPRMPSAVEITEARRRRMVELDRLQREADMREEGLDVV